MSPFPAGGDGETAPAVYEKLRLVILSALHGNGADRRASAADDQQCKPQKKVRVIAGLGRIGLVERIGVLKNHLFHGSFLESVEGSV